MTNILKTKEDVNLILSSVRALWGAIVPSLRSVSIGLQNNKVTWQCIFDDNATNDELELLSAAAAEIIADFPGYGLEEIIKRVPYPHKAEHLKNLIYLRYEPNF